MLNVIKSVPAPSPSEIDVGLIETPSTSIVNCGTTLPFESSAKAVNPSEN